MGVVYLARDVQLGRKIALKLIEPALACSPDAVSMFLREARATARFNHPHIVTIHAVGQHNTVPFIALEYLEGQTLRERLDGAPLGAREAIRTALAVADALREAHGHGIVHGDLKPDNVVIPTDGRLRVVDFGVCRVMDPGATGGGDLPPVAPNRTRDPWDTTVVWLEPLERGRAVRPTIGTPAFMSPEQWRGGQVSGSADIWALGLIIGDMVAHWHPYSALMTDDHSVRALGKAVVADEPVSLPEALGPDVPETLLRLLGACLDKDPSRRPSAADLVDLLQALLVREAEVPTNPFPGLEPFAEEQARFFFGRETEVAAFVERLRTEAVMPVVGPTGVGKSSFVRAGVIPRLKEQGDWIVIEMRPGADPFATLAEKVLAAGSNGATRAPAEPSLTPQDLWRQLIASPLLLSLRLRAIAHRRDCRVLLFVDQLEQVVAMVDDPVVRRSFIEAICAAADDRDDPLRVIFTLRDDFIGRLAETPAARQVLGRVTVLAGPDAAALERIVSRPIETLGYEYDDPQLPQDMVTSVVGASACLPLLQFTTRMLWERRDRRNRSLHRAVYDAFGGVAGALATHAEGVLDCLSPAQRSAARSILLRLVSPEGTRQALGRDELLDGLGQGGPEVLGWLIGTRLVAVRQFDDHGVAELELIHDSLTHSWSRLSRWITEGMEELHFVGEMTRAANLWFSRGRRSDEVWGEQSIRDAERALQRRSLPVAPQVHTFLEAARTRARQRRRRRWALATLLALVAALALAGGTLAVATVVARGTEARLERDRALRSWAEAQREGAGAALERGDLLEARAKLRGSLEAGDSPAARVLWRRLGQHPLLWSRQLGTILYDVAIAPDGATVAAAGQNRSIHLADVRTGRVRSLRGYDDQVFSLAYAPDGRLAGGTLSGEVRLWDRQGRLVAMLPGKGPAVRTLAFAGGRVAIGRSDGSVQLWSAAVGAAPLTLDLHRASVEAVAMVPDGTLLATGSADGEIRLTRPAESNRGQVLRRLGSPVQRLAFSPGGERLAVARPDGAVQIVDPATGRTRLRIAGQGRAVRRVTFSPDGKVIATTTQGGGVRLFATDSGRLLRVLPGLDAALGVHFGPEGRLVATCGMDQTLRLWDLSAGGDTAAHPPRPINSVAIAPDGKVVASGGSDGKVKLWSTATGAPLRVLAGHRDIVYRVAFSPDGRLLASASWDRTVRLWDPASGAPRQVLDGHRSPALDVAFSPDGRLIASASRDGVTRIWRVRSGELLRRLGSHRGAVSGLAFDPIGRLATVSLDRSLRLWDLANGEALAVVQHPGQPYSVTFDRDGGQLATASWDGTVRLWAAEGQVHRIVGRHDGRAYRAVFSSGGHLASAGADGVARLWSTAFGGAPGVVLRGHRGEVNDVAFGSDSRLAATGSDDGTVRLWNVATGRPLWRTAALLDGPRLLMLSQRGWQWLEGSNARQQESVPCGPACREAVSRGAGASAVGGKVLCLRSADDTLELWDLERDHLASRTRLPGLQQVLALPDACASRAAGTVRLHAIGRPARELAHQARFMARDGDSVLVVKGQQVLRPGEAPLSAVVSTGVTALIRAGDRLVLGHRDGTVRVHRLGSDPTLTLQDLPSSPVTALAVAQPGLLSVGFASGELGLWRLQSGARLDRTSLHGAVVHLLERNRRLHAVTELGDHLAWDLDALRRPYCALLRDIWSRVPVVWASGAARARRPPAGHRCLVR